MSPDPSPYETPLRDPAYARRRVRLDSAEFETFPNSRCRCTVSLSWVGKRSVTAVGEGADLPQGHVQAGALACIQAQMEITEGRLHLELGGVKAVRAFDVWVVIVQVRGESADRNYRLTGSVDIADDALPRGAVMAALDATNRILERYLPEPNESGDAAGRREAADPRFSADPGESSRGAEGSGV